MLAHLLLPQLYRNSGLFRLCCSCTSFVRVNGRVTRRGKSGTQLYHESLGFRKSVISGRTARCAIKRLRSILSVTIDPLSMLHVAESCKAKFSRYCRSLVAGDMGGT